MKVKLLIATLSIVLAAATASASASDDCAARSSAPMTTVSTKDYSKLDNHDVTKSSTSATSSITATGAR